MSDRHRKRRGLARTMAVACTVVAALSLGAVPAPAIEAAGGTDRSGGEQHCVVAVIDVMPDGEYVTGPPVCYGTYSQAIAYASGGSVRLPADTPGTVQNYGGGFGGVITSHYGPLATHYDGYYGTGASITIRGAGCGGYWNTWSWWDNRISSTFNICQRTRHYDRPNLSGMYATLSGGLQTHNLPWWMNNRTESVRYILY